MDPDDSRPPYQQVGSSLRASILTKKRGFETGDKLPSGPELAKHFGVARGTVDKALDLLRTEGLIVTRQGSGSFVRERTSRPVGLRPHLEAAFEQQQVTLDFAGFSSETLHNALQKPLDKVRSGRLAPESITIRLLLPDTTAPMAVPVLVDGLQDEAALRQRARNIALTNAGGIAHSVEMLAELGLVQKASVEVKVHRGSSLFKLKPVRGVLRLLPAPRAHRGDRRHRPHLLRRHRQGHHPVPPRRRLGRRLTRIAVRPASPAVVRQRVEHDRLRAAVMIATAQQLADVLRPVKHVLLDFDGPVCSVFAGLPASEVARRLREGLFAVGEQGPSGAAEEDDPLALLRLVSEARPDLVERTDVALAALETEAIRVSRPTLGGESVLRACARSGRLVSVVSNNAGAAIDAYLVEHGLSGYVAGIFGRAPDDPSSMKPNPRLLLEAMAAAGSKPVDCVFIGDAVRDVEAGDAAGVPTIGYANKPGKDAKLAAIGAVVVVESMQHLADALV
ncbi:HAD-IA family hydrolase [Kitasatospora sp. NPDC097605]|uniref:HAD-IA family hydrolase n=1 Tax=Kitasatospora sp. NPDC097605 TaxID=3157226 RepID=UPI00331A0BE0